MAPWSGGTGDPSRFTGLPAAGEPFHALRVRPMDGPGVPDHSVRTVLRRCSSALCQREASPLRAGADRCQAGRARAAAAPRQNADNILRADWTRKLVRAHLVHALGIRVPQARSACEGRGVFNGFLPGVSRQAIKKMNQVVKGWQLHRWTRRTLNELAAWVNQIVPGWVRYYGRYYPSLLRPLLRRINAYILC